MRLRINENEPEILAAFPKDGFNLSTFRFLCIGVGIKAVWITFASTRSSESQRVECMNTFSFHIEIKGKPKLARLRFATKTELQAYNRSLLSASYDTSQTVKDAVEFTRLAAKRWRYYSEAGEAVESLAELRQSLARSKRCEVAFILLATTTVDRRETPVGLAYCRRTWCHHLALDFLALHPRTLGGQEQIAGVGSGIVYGLVKLAKTLRIRRIWGEATVHSAPFYERLLVLAPILDLFVIESRAMTEIQNRQAKIARRGLAINRQRGLK